MKSRRTQIKVAAPRIAASDSRRVRPPPKVSQPFYKSAAYLDWRQAVIDRANGRCQTPGCGRAEARMFADHIRELRDGGAPLDVANGQCLCGAHHTIKTSAARAARLRA